MYKDFNASGGSLSTTAKRLLDANLQNEQFGLPCIKLQNECGLKFAKPEIKVLQNGK